MNKKTKAALAALSFVAGCEIGIAIQLMKMIHKFTVTESAMKETIPDGLRDEDLDEISMETEELSEVNEESATEEEA